MARRSSEKTFAEIVADVERTPARAAPVPPGRSRDRTFYGDHRGQRFDSTEGALDPALAVELLVAGATVVYDSCGCGGSDSGCRLDWLGEADLHDLAVAPPPDVHPTKDGMARLVEWRTPDGQVLIEVACEISWGSRIPR